MSIQGMYYRLLSSPEFNSNFENMTFSEKRGYNRLFMKLVQKGGESEINYIKIFQNSKALVISVGKSYSEYRLMDNFLDNFQQGGKILISNI